MKEPKPDRRAIANLRARIDVGWEQAERGQSRDGETVFREMRKRLLKLLRQSRPKE